MRRFFYHIIFLMGWGSFGHSQIIYIPGDRPTIQAGIEASSDGDTILIGEGTYFENINFLGKAITVASHFLVDGDTSHISRTIIDGSRPANPDTASVVALWSGEDTTSILCGLTITGGSGTFVRNIHTGTFLFPSRLNYYAGGGILIYNSGGKIIHNIIEGNQMPVPREGARGSLGCGILAAVNHNHSVLIRNNLIRENSSRMNQAWGGGICIYGGRALVENNHITDNLIEVEGLGAGAGIFFENELIEGIVEEVVIRNNQITGNKAISDEHMAGGGGIALSIGFDTSRIQVCHNLIAYNETSGVGGGVYGWASRIDLCGNLIFNNKADFYGDELGTEAETDINLLKNHIWTGENWILTYEGVSRIKTARGGIVGFDPPEGIWIPPDESSFSIDPSTGELHIGSKAGMISFDPDTLNEHTFLAPSVFVEFWSGREPDAASGESAHPIGQNRKIRMELPMQHVLWKFRIGMFDADYPKDTRYISFFKGVDRDTSEVIRGDKRQFAHLKPGRYQFWIARPGADGPDHSGAITLDIRVYAPWYRSPWILGGSVLGLVLLVMGLVRARTSKLLREKMRLEEEVNRRTADLQQKNKQIMEMEQLKTRFFTDISHEIRTPLSLITAPLEQIIRKDHHDAKTREWLTMIRRNTNRLLLMVNQLLDISRLDAGQMKLLLDHSDPLDHLRILLNEFRSLAESKGILYVIVIPEGGTELWNDTDKITKVVTNLLSNAFKFTPAEGKITCRVRIDRHSRSKRAPLLRITVANSGPGIPREDREKIFDRFYRAAGSTDPESSGTGIGLAVTRELLNLMHGEITLKSMEGRGNVFEATIPLGKDHLSEHEFLIKSPDRRKKREALLRKRKGYPEPVPSRGEPPELETWVLVVEDNHELRSFIRDELSESYQVLEAEDGNRGLKLARSAMPDLVISDIMMPEMDGLEFCRRLKNDEMTSHIPVIILTARSTPGDRLEGLKQGADAYIFKPFQMVELMVRIRNLLEQRERLRRKYATLVGLDWQNLKVTSLDDEFLKKALGIISGSISDMEFNVGVLQEKMSMSRVHLYRKMKALTGKSPSDLIREIRIRTAAAILKKGGNKITEVALNVGFSNLSYFTQCFKKQFGVTPQQYRMI